jgi:Endonuclease/Exonuclease/phosphatase family
MATFLFWNLNRKPLLTQVVALCHEHDVDVLILAESVLSAEELREALNSGQRSQFQIPAVAPPSRLSFFMRYPRQSLRPVYDDGRIAIRRFLPPSGFEILIVAVHLPSKLHGTETDQTLNAPLISRVIDRAEAKVGHTRTVVVGDFNMNPFEPGLVGATGFHAVSDRRTAQRRTRTVSGKQYRFFYNPMWGRMGETSPGPPGTYYFNTSRYINFFWNTFDQVLVRPELLKFFPDERLAVLSKVKDQSLLSPTGIPDTTQGSDHLPLLFAVDIEERD